MKHRSPLTEKGFQRIYNDALQGILEFWTVDMQKELAVHCYGWRPECFDFDRYLKASWVRYYRTYQYLLKAKVQGAVCDIGGFWGVFPVTLQRLGFQVTMTESLKFYSGSFENLFAFIRRQGVTILDLDPFERLNESPGTFDMITVMAILEHYPHSPKIFMENVISMMQPHGKLYVEVPNIAYWQKRVKLLQGCTPLVPILDIVRSHCPFIGHHHEYTMGELKDLVTHFGLKVVSEDFYNYSPSGGRLFQFIHYPIQSLAWILFPDSRECLAVLCSK
jgi:hypothetical protein